MDLKETARKKYNYAIMLGGATFVGALFVIGVVLYPLYNVSRSVTTEANTKQQTVDTLKKKKEVLDGLVDKKDSLEKDAALLSAALPESNDVGRLFIQFDALAKEVGSDIAGVSGASNASSTSVQTTNTAITGVQKYSYAIPLNFQNYQSMKSFITNSKNALRLLNIEDMSVSSSNGGTLSTNMNITTYARK